MGVEAKSFRCLQRACSLSFSRLLPKLVQKVAKLALGETVVTSQPHGLAGGGPSLRVRPHGSPRLCRRSMGRRAATRLTAKDIKGGVAALIPALIKKVVDGENMETKEAACAQLRSLAQQDHGEHCSALFNAGAVRALIKILADGSANAQGSAAGALHAIAIVKEEHQRAVMTGGGIAPLVKLLRFGSSKVQEEVSPKPVRPPSRL